MPGCTFSSLPGAGMSRARHALLITALTLVASGGVLWQVDQSGGQPAGSFDRLSNYVFETAGGLSGVVNSVQRGNPNLKPEVTTEVELGADASFFGGAASTPCLIASFRFWGRSPATAQPSFGISGP